ncbi:MULTISPECIES: GNAT family N-acetyltransferase [unclassified Acinetobacter]|uniref:GNAT family N-acetyltransferase n=1 Tax=unclassified Acinetobacter TaxID=196816 RepID=UPI002934980C|nr:MULTISPECIES: GNAT family N-acetyltransferase [unclassified Acinetobacter]WOE31857.1 GNAT family N-acetyltransferase [Acinetobacter sp. SAAs470]WOE37324.1 GNAT family N-acetyltransferase [Acinetobacter sp. SAAs474]
MSTFFNQLEPQNLVEAFLKHPPYDFELNLSAQIPCFYMSFNLLTTLDGSARKKIQSLYAYTQWEKILHFPTCFIGTTVSEYTPLLSKMSPEKAVETFKILGKKQRLTIIKDLPIQSPLLSQAENDYSAALIKAAQQQDFFVVQGQALAYVHLDFSHRDDYLARFSKQRRKNLKRKLKSLANLRVECLKTGATVFDDFSFRQQLYALYFAVYQQSEIHFDLLTAEFFDEILQDSQSGGCVFCYWDQDILVGYNICYQYGDKLIDKYIGMNYPLAKEHNLYFISWFVNLDYALQHQLKYYVAGWTDPEVKAQLGAQFTFTQHLVWIRSPILNTLLRPLKHLFEADLHWQQQKN